MTEIHVLSVAHLEPFQVDRLSAALAEAHTAGVDLGSRVPHIHDSAQSLIDLSSKLQSGTARLAATLDTLGIKDPATMNALECIIKACRTLSQSAASFPSHFNDET